MASAWEAVQDVVRQARDLDQARRHFAAAMARLLVGYLRGVDDAWTLTALKRELHSFDARSGKWRK